MTRILPTSVGVQCKDVPSPGVPPLRAGPPVPPELFTAIRRRMVLDCCKWDPQVGDVATLAPFPLLLRSDVWRRLAHWAECLAYELAAAESELLRAPHLLDRLGLPRPVRRLFRDRAGRSPLPASPPAARVIRFDFHWTSGNPEADGWHISEANSDVPGGFTEASSLTAMMADQLPGPRPAGDPADRWADAIADAAGGSGAAIALLCAAGYMEDQQVMAYLARLLRTRGLTACLADPRQLRWDQGTASLQTADPLLLRLAAVVRFYQGEWLALLPRRCGWSHLFVGGRTPVANPGSALLTESKRFPLAWDAGGHRGPGLSTPLPTWRLLLPETRDPRDAAWRTDDGWLLKPAFGNTGDDVAARAWSKGRDRRDARWRAAARAARWSPGRWVAQRRFDTLPIPTPAGPMYPCVGVYTVNGRAAGIYGRLSPRPLVDYAATDVAVLVDDDEGEWNERKGSAG